MGIVSPAVGDAMVKQLKRTRRQSPSDVIVDLNVQITRLERELRSAKAQVETLLDENDALRQGAKWAKQPTPGKSFTFNGRPVVNQVEAARLLKVNQSQVSRWLKAGKLERADIPGKARPMIYADPLTRPACKAGRPKKTR